MNLIRELTRCAACAAVPGTELDMLGKHILKTTDPISRNPCRLKHHMPGAGLYGFQDLKAPGDWIHLARNAVGR